MIRPSHHQGHSKQNLSYYPANYFERLGARNPEPETNATSSRYQGRRKNLPPDDYFERLGARNPKPEPVAAPAPTSAQSKPSVVPTTSAQPGLFQPVRPRPDKAALTPPPASGCLASFISKFW